MTVAAKLVGQLNHVPYRCFFVAAQRTNLLGRIALSVVALLQELILLDRQLKEQLR